MSVIRYQREKKETERVLSSIEKMINMDPDKLRRRLKMERKRDEKTGVDGDDGGEEDDNATRQGQRVHE
jgi:hypothetical protein